MKGSLLTVLKDMTRVRVRSEPAPEPAVIATMNTMKGALREMAEPKPEASQVEPMAIPDVVHFEPLVVLPSNIGPGYYIEIDDAKHYGATPLEALGQAVLNGAFGALNIVIP